MRLLSGWKLHGHHGRVEAERFWSQSGHDLQMLRQREVEENLTPSGATGGSEPRRSLPLISEDESAGANPWELWKDRQAK